MIVYWIETEHSTDWPFTIKDRYLINTNSNKNFIWTFFKAACQRLGKVSFALIVNCVNDSIMIFISQKRVRISILAGLQLHAGQ